ncbi:MAG: hypothetical protein R3320_04560 [Nitriliruptorales bacterium]|nr:hypothetical protein [Nitriliruptorales bacterium]
MSWIDDLELRLRLLPGVIAVGVDTHNDEPVLVVGSNVADVEDAVRERVGHDEDPRVEVVALPETPAEAVERQLRRVPAVREVRVHADEFGSPSSVDVQFTPRDTVDQVRDLVAELAGPSCDVRFELCLEFELPSTELG